MSKHILRDSQHREIGEVREMNGVHKLYDPRGHLLGEYREREDITYDAHRHRVGYGNLLTTLL